MNTLKKALFDKYGGFADKRIKNLDKGSIFLVDDRGDGDYGADKKLFLWFCAIFAEVKSRSEVVIRLSGGVPWDSAISAWAKANKMKYSNPHHAIAEIIITKSEESKLHELASLMEAIVASGKRYEVAAYKYVCPRTAKSLRRLAKELSAAWGT